MKNLYLVFCLFCISPSLSLAQGNCTTEVGTLAVDTAFICVQGSIEVETEGAVLGEADVLVYFIHTTPDIFEGTIVDTSLTGTIEWNAHENEAIEFHQLYYLSAAAGLDEDANGLLDDLTAECTSVSEAKSVVWAAEIEFFVDVECEDSGAYFDHDLCSYQGGQAYVISSIEQENLTLDGLERTFTIKANDREFETSQYFSFVAFHDEIINHYIDIQVSDEWQCLDTTFVVEISWCHPSSYLDYQGISNMPNELQIICGNEETAIDAGCIYALSPFGGENEHYVISLTPEYNYLNEDSIIAVNDTTIGIFNYQDVEGYLNRELYVFARQETFNGSSGQWDLFVSHEPTPVIFLQPFEVDIIINDCETSIGNVQLSVTGGFPSYDNENTDSYQVVSDLYEGESVFGEEINISLEKPLVEFGENISFQISDGFGCAQSIEVPNPCLTDVGIYIFEIPSFSLENVYPIPAKDFVQIHLHALQNETVQLQLMDITGKVITKQFHELQSGDHHLQLEMSEFSTGIYFCR